jgi:polysaccharide pyruvyl transferase WcaK-like protein
MPTKGLGGRPLVGMSVRERGGAAPSLEGSGYHAVVAAAADFVIDRFEADVVFVPMERDDVRESHRVMAEMAAPERARVLSQRYGPRELLGLMRHLDLAVGMRLHFLIFAALAGVPLLALPYASKVAAFLEAVGAPAPADLQQHPGPLLAAVDRLWEGRDESRRLLAERVPDLQERARETARVIREVLEGGARTEAGQTSVAPPS